MEPKSSTKLKRRAGRTWLLRLSLMVCVPALLIGVAEGILRLAGYGHPSSFFVSSPHHGEGELIENAKFAWRFLPPTLARASQPIMIHPEKSPGTIRVFVFGESAAEGDPEPAFGLPRLLEVLLEPALSALPASCSCAVRGSCMLPSSQPPVDAAVGVDCIFIRSTWVVLKDVSSRGGRTTSNYF